MFDLSTAKWGCHRKDKFELIPKTLEKREDKATVNAD